MFVDFCINQRCKRFSTGVGSCTYAIAPKVVKSFEPDHKQSETCRINVGLRHCHRQTVNGRKQQLSWCRHASSLLESKRECPSVLASHLKTPGTTSRHPYGSSFLLGQVTLIYIQNGRRSCYRYVWSSSCCYFTHIITARCSVQTQSHSDPESGMLIAHDRLLAREPGHLDEVQGRR